MDKHHVVDPTLASQIRAIKKTSLIVRGRGGKKCVGNKPDQSTSEPSGDKVKGTPGPKTGWG